VLPLSIHADNQLFFVVVCVRGMIILRRNTTFAGGERFFMVLVSVFSLYLVILMILYEDLVDK